MSVEDRLQLPVGRPSTKLSRAATAVTAGEREGGLAVRILRRMPRTACAVALAAVALGANTPAAARAGAHPNARSAATCANERVVLGDGTEVFFAFTLKGGMSCSKARALIKGYMHRATTGKGCVGRGTMCGYQMTGGWWCTVPGYSGARVDGGCCAAGPHFFGNCVRKGASFTVSETSPPPSWHAVLHLRAFELPDRSISCGSVPGPSRGYTGCSISTNDQYGVPAAWMEAPHVRVCTHREELVQPEGEGSACPTLDLQRTVILAYGLANEVGGIRCVSAPEGMTCTFTAGPEAGKGFRINSSEVMQLA